MRVATGTIAFTNISSTPEYRVKAQRTTALLARHLSITTHLGGRQCDIVLEKRLLDAPAEIDDQPGKPVTVRLAAYYFEEYRIGYVLGMLCHEFGIHPIGDQIRDIVDEERTMLGTVRVPCLNGMTVNASLVTTKDHVFGVINDGSRHKAYRKVVLEMAELLHHDATTGVPGASTQDVTDLLNCFLMDLASIAATNDSRLRGLPMRPGSTQVRTDIATAYQAYKRDLGNDPQLNPALTAHFPPDKTLDMVTAEFNTLASTAFRGAFSSPSISTR